MIIQDIPIGSYGLNPNLKVVAFTDVSQYNFESKDFFGDEAYCMRIFVPNFKYPLEDLIPTTNPGMAIRLQKSLEDI